jgi:D-glutamate N-acetyltransferase
MPTHRRYAVLTEGFIADRHAKTAFGVMRYGRDDVVAVIDSTAAGRHVDDLHPHVRCSAPIVSSVADALSFQPTSLLIGVANAGGFLPAAFRPRVLDAIEARLEIVSGLHEFLADDPEFAGRAKETGAQFWDVRRPPEPIPIFSGAAYSVPQVVVLAVGSDCAIGKMTVMLELERAGRAAGARPEFVATGQTGIMIAGSGISVDRVISDFVTGAAEQLVTGVSPGTDVTLVEGQGAIHHPAYGPVTLGLMYGCAPDLLVLCHRAGQQTIEDFDVPIPPLRDLARDHEQILARVKPARCAAVALNTSGLDEQEAREAIAAAELETGLPADDVVRNGAGKLWNAVARAAEETAKRRRAS